MGLSLKLAVLSATVLSTAVIFNLLSPFVTNFSISDLPVIWTSLVSWLKPPYLYVVINCIIITIVASSRLQSKHELFDHHSLSTFPTTSSTEAVKGVQPVELLVHHEPVLSFPSTVVGNENTVLGNEQIDNFTGYKINNTTFPNKELVDNFNGYKISNTVFPNTVLGHEQADNFAGYKITSGLNRKAVEALEPEFNDQQLADHEPLDEDMKIAKKAYEEIKKNRVNKPIISTSAWTPADTNQFGSSLMVEKPPASTRFSHRKPAKAAPEGGRTLGVAKPKRQDTLESTWKTITEGRSVPLTKHLRKSDTWETHGSRRENDEFSTDNQSDRMTKSDTFDVKRSKKKAVKPPPAPSKLRRSGGSGRIKKEVSVGQEELNRRVEAFIKKVNEDMRLQRQESVNQFMEMINRGAH